MVMIVAIILWIATSNLVLAAPAVVYESIPESPTETQDSEAPEFPVAKRSVTFSYKDSNFEQVFLSGTFTNWVKVPMALNGNNWSLTISVPEDQQYYNFLVDEGDDSWVAIDPDNSRASNHEEFGWVSVLGSGHRDKDAGYEQRQAKRKKEKTYRNLITNELHHGQLLMGDVNYQRVDGLVVGAGLTHVGSKGGLNPSAMVRGYYGFSSGRFGGSLAILQPIIPDHLLDLKLNLFDKTESNNHLTGIGDDENSLAGLLFHEDYRDYHRSKGVKFSLIFKLGSWLRLQGGVRAEEQSSLWAPSVWSIKSGSFSPNPDIDEGSLNSLFGNIAVGGKYNYITASYQRSHENLVGGDFDFEKVDAKVRGRLNLGEDAGFDIRLAAGSNLRGQLPAQERYLLGGLGTVRGYSYQSLMITDSPQTTDQYGGQRMALGNLEYFLHLGKCLKLTLYYDVGMVWENKDATPSFNQLKTSTGLGVNIGPGKGLRINMTQRLDDRSQPVVFQLRIERMF